MDSSKKHKNPWLFARLGRKPKMYFLLRPGSCSWFCIGRIQTRFWISSFDFIFLSCPREAQHSSLYFMYKLDGTQLFPFAGIFVNLIENTVLDWVRGSWNMHPETFNGSSMHLWCWWEPRRSTWKPIHPRKSHRREPFQSRSTQYYTLVLFQYSKYTSLDHNLWTSIYKMYNPDLCDANSSCNLAMLVQESN